MHTTRKRRSFRGIRQVEEEKSGARLDDLVVEVERDFFVLFLSFIFRSLANSIAPSRPIG